jgi:HEAT repeat protein
MGKAGSGKSTALQQLLLNKAKEAQRNSEALIPVLVKLRSWQSFPSVIALIQDVLETGIQRRLDEETIIDLLFAGRLLLLIDGVNELPSYFQDRNPSHDVEAFRKKYRKTSMIFTTRVLGVSRNLGIAKQMEMLPLSDREMRQFIERCLPQQIEQMLNRLGDRLRRLGETPLLLSMLCDISRQREDGLPANLGSPFREFAEIYDHKIQENIPVDDKYKRWVSELLQQLAFAMMPQNDPHGLQQDIPKFEAEKILVKLLYDESRDYAKQCLENLFKYHLIQVNTDQKIKFCHQSIQEYYAAEYLWRQLEDLTNEKLQKSYINYCDWKDSLALMLNFEDRKEQAVRVVRLALDVDLRLGARLAGLVKYEFQEKTVGLLIQEIDARKVSRLISVRLLGETKSDAAVEYLSRELKKNNYDELDIEIIEALQKIRSIKASETLIKSLQYQNYETCLNILFTLSEIGNKICIESLIKEVKNQKSRLRWKAVQLIGSVAYSPIENLIEPLVDALSDKGFEDRDIAATSLGNLVVDKSAEFLIQVLKNKSERHDVRRSAALALENLGGQGNKKAIELLVELLKDENHTVCSKAKWALIGIGNQNVVEVLNEFIHREDLQPKDTAISILNHIEKDQEELNARIERFDNKYIQKGEPLSFDDNCDPELLIQNLINSLDDDEYESAMARNKLMMMCDVTQYLDILIKRLPTLFDLIGASEHIYSIITAIQSRCKYYNYDIAQTPLQEAENHADPVEYTLNELTKAVKKMSDAPKYDLRGAKIDKLIDNIGVYNENNFAPEQKQNLADAAKEIQDLLDQLAKTYPSATEAEAKDLVKAMFEEIKTKHPDKWKILWSQILNPERWLNGGKAALSETAKHYAENSLILKAGIAFLDGFSADEE